MLNKCPGQDSRKIKVESITCNYCGYAAEIFSDEPGVRCPKCGKRICREMSQTCAKWCKAAKDCLGFNK
ncbi:MAG: phosphohydrolase [Candidatus Omnitrophica bacterium]|nr:phosphohydrolase [Candidatus Omnitrophota bacterium]